MSRKEVNSEAFSSLSGVAILVYHHFKMKCQMEPIKAKPGRKRGWRIKKYGELEYTYSEAEKRGITRPRFKRALKELIEKGFLDITHSGMGGRKGDKSLYAISERWKKHGTSEFQKVAMQKDTRKGRGFALYWKKIKNNHR